MGGGGAGALQPSAGHRGALLPVGGGARGEGPGCCLTCFSSPPPNSLCLSTSELFYLVFRRSCICQHPFADGPLRWGQKKDNVFQ